MKLLLAPMEGLVDWIFRDLLTQVGGIDQCVTEFVRVTDRLLPDHVFLRYCPELRSGSKTAAGTPVFVQLLGGQAGPLAENASFAASLGAAGIDLNFGCPAKTVNRHDGGATLLKFPDRIQKILESVRAAVPKNIPVTAKIRLGYDSPTHCLDIAQAVKAAGISTITIHCRTKTDMYRPPAHWDWIPKIRDHTGLNIIANGEIWTVEDFENCRRITGCEDFMIGRGAIANPFLFSQVRRRQEGSDVWFKTKKLLPNFYDTNVSDGSEMGAMGRTKQWLAYISRRDPRAQPCFEEIKLVTQPQLFRQKLIEVSESH